MKNKCLLSMCLTCLLLLTGCTTGNAELDEALNNTLITAAGALENGTKTDAEDDSNEESQNVTDSVEEEVADVSDNPTDENTDVTDTEADDNITEENTDVIANDTVNNTDENPYWNSKYAYLQALLKENDCMGGAMYVDMSVGDDWDAEYIQWELNHEDAMSEYKTVFGYNTSVVLGEGEYLFALIPGEGAWITIYPSEMNENAEYVDDLTSPLYEGKVGEPILLRCNYSDWHSNVYVTVQNEEATYELRPTMSGNHSYAMTQTNGWYDFATLDIRSIDGETFLWLWQTLEEVDSNDHPIIFMGPRYHYNHYVLTFHAYDNMDDYYELNDNYSEYAVDFTYTYKLDPETDCYQVIGDGVPFKTLEEAVKYYEKLAEIPGFFEEINSEDGGVG